MAKARIRTTMQKDYFGTGNEKEITMDDGRVYRIKSTVQKDYFGNGQELEIKMNIKTVKIGLANASYITIPYEKISYIKFNGKDISECDINALDRPNFKIRFRSDTGFLNIISKNMMIGQIPTGTV